MGKKDIAQQEESFISAPAKATSAGILGPMDVQQKEFGVSRFGGYKMRDVDEFLDRITDSMSALVAENDRLRKGAPASAIVGTPDLADVSRQADEIIQRARAEAARIVAEAKTQTPMPGAGSGGAQDRAAVQAFLAREREFLQNLAGLVQGHAEQVKAMAKATKSASQPAEAKAEPKTEAKAEPKTETNTDSGSETTTPPQAAAVVPARPEPSQPQPSQPEPTQPEPARTEPTVRIGEPEPASMARTESDPEKPAEGDRSLRDLFWGED